ncbi:MAG: extracellular solute-binding protein [Candidatus Nanopelagicales bacterium]
MRKSLAVGLVTCTLVAGGCAADSTSETTAEPTQSVTDESTPPEIQIWADPAHYKALDDTAADYLARTGVDVIVVEKDLSKIQEEMVEFAPQGSGPDLFVGQGDWVGTFEDGGLISPVSLGEKAGSFRDVSTAAFQYEGKSYGVPLITENLALLRNTALAPEAPKSIEDMASAGLALKKAGKVDLPIALPVGKHGDAYHWYPMYSAAGGYIYGQEADGSYDESDLGVGKEGSVAAAAQLAKLADQGAIDSDTSAGEATDAFAAGKAAFLIAGPWAVAPAQKAGIPVAVGPVPGFASIKGSSSQAMVESEGLMLSAFAPNAEAAEQYLADTVMTTAFMDAIHKADTRAPAWAESYTKAAADPITKAFADYADASEATPTLPTMEEVWTALSDAELDVIAGKDPEKTMKTAKEEITEAAKTS